MSNRAAVQEFAKGPFTVQDVDKIEPGEGEVRIKVHACAIQPADAKIAKYAFMPLEYPTILGSPVAGIVDEIGPGVKEISLGQRVVCGTKIFTEKKAKYGGLQQYCIVDASEVIDIGDVDFVKATTLASYTPPAALFGNGRLNMHRPTIPPSPLPASEQGKKILIWGGSSAMGSLSISYAKLAGYTVISTCSPHNFDLLKSLGADHVFDHSDPKSITAIRELFPIDYWFDTISLKPSLSAIVEILAPKGKAESKTDILTLLPPAFTRYTDPLPDGITMSFHQFSTHSPENQDWHKHFIAPGGFMEKAMKSGDLKGVPAEVIGGLGTAGEGIDRVAEGVSGRKIVVEPWRD